MQMDKGPTLPSELGAVSIADEVVSVIAGLAATEIEGVAGMSGGIVGGIAEALGRKNLSKGVKVEVSEQEATIDLSLIVDYETRIPDVAWAVQDKVKKAIETMTGLAVVNVNIHVLGVSFTQETDDESKPEEKGI